MKHYAGLDLSMDSTQVCIVDGNGRKVASIKLRKHSPNDWQRKVLERFDRIIKQKGLLHILKKGLQVDNAFLVLMYPAPLASSSVKVHENFYANLFSVMRQVRYSQANPLQEIDMVLFLNGMPLITLELKNAWTGQTARYHGQKQYREGRDPTQPLLQFGRALVHMAVDTDEVFMTTKLAGKGTFFLPFNKGYKEGEGNPPNPNGHKTAYLWEEVFDKRSLAGIIQHFVLLEGDAKDPLAKKTLIFPRYHQLDVVRKLLDHAATTGVEAEGWRRLRRGFRTRCDNSRCPKTTSSSEGPYCLAAPLPLLPNEPRDYPADGDVAPSISASAWRLRQLYSIGFAVWQMVPLGI